jgi:hypothetical protein
MRPQRTEAKIESWVIPTFREWIKEEKAKKRVQDET